MIFHIVTILYIVYSVKGDLLFASMKFEYLRDSEAKPEKYYVSAKLTIKYQGSEGREKIYPL